MELGKNAERSVAGGGKTRVRGQCAGVQQSPVGPSRGICWVLSARCCFQSCRAAYREKQQCLKQFSVENPMVFSG